MAKLIIKIEKDDIVTSKIGENIMIDCGGNVDIVFTPESLEELLKDYKIMSKWQNSEEKEDGKETNI